MRGLHAAATAASWLCGDSQRTQGWQDPPVGFSAMRWTAAVAVDLASRPDPSWFGNGRPAVRDRAGVGRPEVLNWLFDGTVRLHGEVPLGSSQP